ncbi:protein CPH1, putative [Plasmodium yoelii]|uniref:Protein CPH1 n=3 Tax=Plasmodium yoelii TaxID=5861 RepID=A0AAF0B138_PLAYO|nr:protein CPH1, putative [Plasmodium yoelii]EAA21469.1 hypothetical protein [Plasmodium yoelii yoelii]WBY56113.1 protein CPH1 [Plasmodium yoelii yoelii]CDU17084.1 conserved Plasmodium protein, unknown function [Plasmodium yoelii]VTZ75542.1 protein CPH1, putative [Plasmodium yoelii]|eukprot:XP_729904.1 protein CPH1, putative [Plasmodium yoelii]
MEFPNDVWFNNKTCQIENLYRKNHTIHYYLKKNDIVTALAEIRKGVSPFIKDECNRTSLDIAIVLFMRKFNEFIFTSLIIDYLYKTKNKTEEVKYRYNCKGILEKYDNKRDYNEYDIFHNNYKITHVNDQDDNFINSILLKKKIKYNSFIIKDYNNNNSEDISNEKYDQKNLFFSFQKTLILNLSKNMKAQLNEILRQARALLFFIKTLSKNIILKKSAKNVIKEEIEKLPFPYFYNVAIHTLFKFFSPERVKVKRKKQKNKKINERKNHTSVSSDISSSSSSTNSSGKGGYNSINGWDVKNPADSRKLITKILTNKLIGNEIIIFIGTFFSYFSNLVFIFGEKIFRTNLITSQYLLHMSFTLDNEYLFNVIINRNNIFNQVQIFDWNKLIDSLLPQQNIMQGYYKPLIYAKLSKSFLDKVKKFYQNKKKKKIQNDYFKNAKIISPHISNLPYIIRPSSIHKTTNILKR